jgi:hypothetical protein
VELHVLHLDGFASRGAAGGFEHGFVVEAEAEFGHPGEVALHFYGAEDFGAQDVAGGADEEVERFDNVEEDFVFAVADAFAAPGDGVCDGDGGAGGSFEFVGFLGNVSGW